MTNNIVAIHSADGGYFSIGKTEDGYYLKNRYTEIPNEFNRFSLEIVKELFDGLCERIPECIEVDYVDWNTHPNAFMYVIYDDMSEHLYKEQEGVGKNLCAYTGRASRYSEFLEDNFITSYVCSETSLD